MESIFVVQIAHVENFLWKWSYQISYHYGEHNCNSSPSHALGRQRQRTWSIMDRLTLQDSWTPCCVSCCVCWSRGWWARSAGWCWEFSRVGSLLTASSRVMGAGAGGRWGLEVGGWECCELRGGTWLTGSELSYRPVGLSLWGGAWLQM